MLALVLAIRSGERLLEPDGGVGLPAQDVFQGPTAHAVVGVERPAGRLPHGHLQLQLRQLHRGRLESLALVEDFGALQDQGLALLHVEQGGVLRQKLHHLGATGLAGAHGHREEGPHRAVLAHVLEVVHVHGELPQPLAPRRVHSARQLLVLLGPSGSPAQRPNPRSLKLSS